MVFTAPGNPHLVRTAGRDDAAAAARLFALMAAETAGITPEPTALHRTMCTIIATGAMGLLVAESRDLTTEEPLSPLPTQEGGDVVGMCLTVALPDPWIGRSAAEIRALVVEPAYRRQGVGRSLLAAAAEWARSRDCAYLWMLAEPDNPAAQALYRAEGMTHKDARYFELPL